MGERRDPELTDEALEGEIELVGELVVAATEQDGPLSERDIDRILGIVTPPAHDHDGTRPEDRDDAAGASEDPPGSGP
jgi:hypothetical protein